MLQFCDIPMEDAGGKRVTPSQQRTSRRWRRRPESLLPPQFSQIDRDREHEVCHEQPPTRSPCGSLLARLSSSAQSSRPWDAATPVEPVALRLSHIYDFAGACKFRQSRFSSAEVQNDDEDLS